MNRWIGLLFLLMAALAGLGWLYLGHAGGPNRTTTQVTIEKGSTASQIAVRLQNQGVLTRSTFWFRAFTKLTGAAKHYRAGIYAMKQPSSIAEIMHTLQEGKLAMVSVTIPEGFALQDIARALEQAGVVSAKSIENMAYNPALLAQYQIQGPSVEGYLFPNTYQFAHGVPAKQVLSAMIEEFLLHVTAQDIDKAKQLGLTRHEWVTLASIIEKEAANPTEYARISSVFHNRLRKGMRLESDPTIIYGLQDYDGNIRRKDIRAPHPYNTYVIEGLPPGPIASPGYGALQGALAPADTDYLFFVANKAREHVFAKTYAEHLKNVQKYQLR
jgi:UPF0755 protein